MDPVLQRLNEIEVAARKIVESAEEKKPALSAAMQEKTEAYDKEIDSQTEARIAKNRKAMDDNNAQLLTKLRQDMAAAKKQVQQNYDQHHEDWAGEIVDHILNSGDIL